MKVLHLAAHLGGGVGKAISALSESHRLDSHVQRTVVLFEEPVKTQFVDKCKENGCRVIIQPAISELERLVADSDIVQLEWWNHPATIKNLCALNVSSMRLLTWSHISGLGYFSIPARLISASCRFVFTSPCSLKSESVINNCKTLRDKLGVVHSCGGFDFLPVIDFEHQTTMSAGYIGSLNFSKLHPDFIGYISQINIRGFQVKMIGDLVNERILEDQCKDVGSPELLHFVGYIPDAVAELSNLNVLLYLLNPEHYGTTENALLESMAMGITPVVMNNECEASIVEHRETGIIVNNIAEFVSSMDWLHKNPGERIDIGKRAARKTRERFSSLKMKEGLLECYAQLMKEPKTNVNFVEVFGSDPSEWFLLNQRRRTIFTEKGQVLLESDNDLYGLLDESKGSVFQFSKYFPENKKLSLWSKHLRLVQ